MNRSTVLHSLAWALLLPAAAAHAQADLLPSIPRGAIAIDLQAVATGLAAPAYAISAPGDASRLYVVEQNGLLRVIQNGSLQAAPALDLRALVSPPLVTTNANDERGLLGLAFHPGFADASSAGYQTLYTYQSLSLADGVAPTYAAPNGATMNYRNAITEWKMSSTTPGVVDDGSAREIISFGKNAGNHNGGTVAFGPDGYLYLGLGDGGNAQRRRPEPHRARWQRAGPEHPAGQVPAPGPAGPDPHRRQRRRRQRQRPVPRSRVQSVPAGGAGARDLRRRLPQPVPLRVRPRRRRPDRRRRRPGQHRGDRPRHRRRQLRLGGEGRATSCSTTAPPGTR